MHDYFVHSYASCSLYSLFYLVGHECGVGVGSLALFIIAHADLLDPFV